MVLENNWYISGEKSSIKPSKKVFREDRVIMIDTSRVIIAIVGKVTKQGIFLKGIPGIFKRSQIKHITKSRLEGLGVSSDDSDEILAGQRSLPIISKQEKKGILDESKT